MAGITTSTTLTNQFQNFFSKELLSIVTQETILDQFGMKAPIPKNNGNRAISMFRFGAPSIADVKTLAATPSYTNEGTAIAPGAYRSLSLLKLDKGLSQYGQVIGLTDILRATDLFNSLQQATKTSGLDMALWVDSIIRNTLIGSNLTLSGSTMGTGPEQAFLSASIEVDGLPFFIGRCQLQSVTLRQDQYFWQGKSYKVAFYGNNADWSTRIGDLLIKDLPFTPHVYSYTDCINLWYSNYPTTDFKYLPIKFKDWATFGEVDALTDSHPALFVISIIEKAFASIGYTLNSFFFATDFFKRLIMPVPLLNRYLQGEYGDDYLNIAADENQIKYAGFTPILIFPNQTVAPFVGPNPYNTGTGFYTVPQLGYYLFEVVVEMTNTL